MSKAYICDRCGKIQGGPMMTIWTVNPSAFADALCGTTDFTYHLCDGCYAEFENEYLANLRSEGCDE